MNKEKKPEFRVSNYIFIEKGKLRELCYIKYFNLRNSVDLKILERVTLRRQMLPGSSLILPWNVICPLKRPVVFWAMYVSVLGHNQRSNRLISCLEYHNFSTTRALVFQVSGDLRNLENCTPYFKAFRGL